MCDRCAELEVRLAMAHEALLKIKASVALHCSGDDHVCDCPNCKCWDISLEALAATADDAASFVRCCRIEGAASMENAYADTGRLLDVTAQEVIDAEWPRKGAGE